MTPTAPTQSYLVWFSQRVGSTLLTQALEDTGIAGRPREWFNVRSADDLLATHRVATALELRDVLWREATTANGVIGMKYGLLEDLHPELTSLLGGLVQHGADPDGRRAWQALFPRWQHVFMTRRNKIRLAVSWWRAIKTDEWQRRRGRAPVAPADLVDLYHYDAIDHLFAEASLREVAIQEQFHRWGLVPHTIVYEDFIAAYEPTVRGVLDFLQIPGRDAVAIPAPAFDQQADEVSEVWFERFHRERRARLGQPR